MWNIKFSKGKKVSIVVPVYNEEKSIRPLYEEILYKLNEQNFDYEIIFVDDGSTDNSFNEISDVAKKNNKVKFIKFRRNFGKSLALSTAFQNTTGEYVVTLDADLQDDPAEIPKLIEKIEEGWDVVSGWKVKRHDPLEKRLPSKLFNFVVSLVSGVKLHDHNCGIKIYRNEVVKTIRFYGEHHRYIPVIASSYGFKCSEIQVNHRRRLYNKSKYGVSRYLAGFFDLFTIMFLSHYNKRPLHFLGKIAMIPFVLSLLLILYVFIMKFGYGQTGVRPSLTLGVFFLGISFQMFFFGLIAELIAFVNFDKNSDIDKIDSHIEVKNVKY